MLPRSVLVAALTALAACTPDSGAGSASRRAREFYAALSNGAFARARSMTVDDQSRQRLETYFGSIEAWGNRLTKNGIVAHTETIEESLNDERASVTLIVIFNDGTRRRDRLELTRTADQWLIDTATVFGARASASADRHEPLPR